MIHDSELYLALKREREFKKAMQREYQRALEREKIRERDWRKTKQGAFESSMQSLDAMMENSSQPDKMGMLSDSGRGVKRMLDELDGESEPHPNRLLRLKAARKRLKKHHPNWIEVFDLIVKNGTNRKESIWQMTSKKLQNGTPQRTDTGTT